MRKIVFAAVVLALMCCGLVFVVNRKPSPRNDRKSWTATFSRQTVSNEIGIDAAADGYIVAVRTGGDRSMIETHTGVQLAPVVETPTAIYSFIPELKLKMTLYRAPQDPGGKSLPDPTCESRPQEFNPGAVIGKGTFFGLPVVKWRKTVPLSAAEEMIVDEWESPDCGCLPLYRNAVVLTAENAIAAVSTEILSDLEWGEPDPALFNAAGFREVTPSEFHEQFQVLKGLQHPLYDKSVLQKWDMKQRDSLKYKFN